MLKHIHFNLRAMSSWKPRHWGMFHWGGGGAQLPPNNSTPSVDQLSLLSILLIGEDT